MTIICLLDVDDTIDALEVFKWFEKSSSQNVNQTMPFILISCNGWEVDQCILRDILKYNIYGHISQEDASEMLPNLLRKQDEPVKDDKRKCTEDKKTGKPKNSYIVKSRSETDHVPASKPVIPRMNHSFKKATNNQRYTGIINFDSKTSFPYTVINPNDHNKAKATPSFFNLIVCHDLFETQERMEHILCTLTSRYTQMQVLLWNYPGQAYTTYKNDDILNNDFHAKCFDKLLETLKTSEVFDVQRPCYLMGVGSGAMVLLFYVLSFRVSLNIRSLLLFNGLVFLDPHYAALMHDCRNVFRCSPSNRPDLPLYFYCRFIFSQKYLKKTGAPLAMNLYSAVHNPLHLKGRIKLCDGVLNNVDIRPMLALGISVPVIAVYGQDSSLVRPIHAQPLLDHLNKEKENLKSIYELLNRRRIGCRVMIITVDGGHELFQEKKRTVLKLIGQLVTGYHEKFDVQVKVLETKAVPSQNTDNIHLYKSKDSLEDRYINAIVAKQNKDEKHSSSASSPKVQEDDVTHWNQFNLVKSSACNMSNIKKETKRRVAQSIKTKPNKKVTGIGEARYSYGEYPEVKEYIAWRAKRNKRRLMRIERAAIDIQRAFRAFLARNIVKLARHHIAVTSIQRVFRGSRGRQYFLGKHHELWAIM